MIDIGRRLKHVLEINNISANKLSREIGVDPSTISKIINGASLPSLDLLDKICNYIDISLKDFFDVKDESIEIFEAEFNELLIHTKNLDSEQIKALITVIKAFNK